MGGHCVGVAVGDGHWVAVGRTSRTELHHGNDDVAVGTYSEKEEQEVADDCDYASDVVGVDGFDVVDDIGGPFDCAMVSKRCCSWSSFLID